MDGRKTFIGYDLGDGETITDLVVLDADQMQDRVQTLFREMTMPDCNIPGKAMPTVFGYDGEGNLFLGESLLDDPEGLLKIRSNFKRRPSDLLPSVSEQRKLAIQELLRDGWPEDTVCPELHSRKMREFAEAVILFTDAIFTDERYQKRIKDASIDSEEIVFCVGHPTRWNDFDVAIYKRILQRTVLGADTYAGLPAELIMAAESRAAFLYVRDKASERILPKDTSVLLIDVGSSTIDLTAMSTDSRNHQYNSGSNYLGARGVDLMIRKWYLDHLREDEENWNLYLALMNHNPALEQALTLSCRMAKEAVYSKSSGIANIDFVNFPKQRLKRADVDRIAGEMALGELLQSGLGLPARMEAAMGEKSWKQLFEEFLRECKAEMNGQGLTVSRIILTGSASKMPFVPELISRVFDEVPADGILNDMNPSRSISMGLALVGPSNEKSREFQKDVELLMAKKAPEIVDKDVPRLANDMAEVVEAEVMRIVKERIAEWRTGMYRTLEDMMARIREDCSEENLSVRMKNCGEYYEVVRNWTVNVVAEDVALELKGICDRYGVDGLILENLNVLKVSKVNVEGLEFDPTKDMLNAMSAIVSVIIGVVSVCILPTVICLVVGLLAVVSETVAVGVALVISSIPGGIYFLTAIGAIELIRCYRKGEKGIRKQLSKLVQTSDLPLFLRKTMTDRKVDQELKKVDLKSKIAASIMEEESRKQLVESVTESLRGQIAARAEDIKYIVENK